MRGWIALTAFVGVVVVGIALALHGPAPTGLESDAKSPEGPDAVESFLRGGSAWRSWTEDEAVRRLVDAPLKWRGLSGLDAEARIGLKAEVARAEERIRGAVRAFHAGDLDEASARHDIELAFGQYSAALDTLSRTR